MSVTWILWTREVKNFFFSPLAYVVIGAFLLLRGVAFNYGLELLQDRPSRWSLLEFSLQSTLFWFSLFSLFPLLTMRLFAEEQKSGTMETLLTAPVRSLHVILAKFGAALFFYALLWALSYAHFGVFYHFTAEMPLHHLGSLYGSAMILVLLGGFFLALGCLVSALTSNQIVAGMVTFSLSVAFFILGQAAASAGDLPGAFLEMVRTYSPYEQVRRFSSGLVDTRTITFYLSGTFLFLFLTYHALEYRKWKV